MGISHKAAICSYVCCIQIIEIIAGIRLGRNLRKSPYPFFIGNIIKTFILGCSCHQRISCTCCFSSFRSFFPLSCQQVSTSQKTVDYCYIWFELLIITAADIVFQIVLRQSEVVENKLINLCHCWFSFRYSGAIARFGIYRNTRSIFIFQVGELIMLYQVQITKGA